MSQVKTNSSGYPLYPPKPSGIKGQQKLLTAILAFAFLAFLPWLPIFGWLTIFDTGTNYGLGNLAFVFAYAAAGIGFNFLIGYSGTLGLAHAGLFAMARTDQRFCLRHLNVWNKCVRLLSCSLGYGWPFF